MSPLTREDYLPETADWRRHRPDADELDPEPERRGYSGATVWGLIACLAVVCSVSIILIGDLRDDRASLRRHLSVARCRAAQAEADRDYAVHSPRRLPPGVVIHWAVAC